MVNEPGITINLEPHYGEYIAYPNWQNPRVILPARFLYSTNPFQKKTVLTLLNPIRLRAKIWKELIYLGVLKGDRVSILEAQDLKLRLGEFFGKEVVLGFKIGTPGAYQKIIIQIMDPIGNVLGYAKSATRTYAVQSLLSEAQTLDRLVLSGVADQVPRKMGMFEWNGTTLLMLSPGPTLEPPINFGPPHEQFLSALQHSFKRVSRFGDSEMWNNIQDLFATLAPYLNGDWKRIYGTLIKDIQEKYGSTSVSLSLAHRDFVPWNTKQFPNGTLFVFDWEFAKEGYIASYDRFHFITMTNLLLGHKERKYCLNDNWEYLVYLLDLSLLYHWFLFARGGSKEDRVLRFCKYQFENGYFLGSSRIE